MPLPSQSICQGLFSHVCVAPLRTAAEQKDDAGWVARVVWGCGVGMGFNDDPWVVTMHPYG